MFLSKVEISGVYSSSRALVHFWIQYAMKQLSNSLSKWKQIQMNSIWKEICWKAAQTTNIFQASLCHVVLTSCLILSVQSIQYGSAHKRFMLILFYHRHKCYCHKLLFFTKVSENLEQHSVITQTLKIGDFHPCSHDLIHATAAAAACLTVVVVVVCLHFKIWPIKKWR